MAKEPSRKYFSEASLLIAARRPEPGQYISGNRRNLQRDKDQHQFHRRRHQAHADRAKQDQPVILSRPDMLHRHVLVRTEDDHGCNRGNHEVKVDAEPIHLDHPPESHAGELCLIQRGRNRRQGSQQRDPTQQFLAGALVHQRIEHHDEHAEQRKNDFRQDTNVFHALRHGLNHGCARRHHWPTTLLASCANGANAVWTAGSIAFSHSSGATPMTRAAAMAGSRAMRSRMSRSGRVSFTGCVIFP